MTNGASDSHRPHQGGVMIHRGWMEAVLRMASHYRMAISPERVKLDLSWANDSDKLVTLARSVGLSIKEAEGGVEALSGLRLPLIIQFEQGEVGVIERETADGFGVILSGEKGLITPFTREQLKARLQQLFVLRPIAARPDRRIDDYIAPYRPDWLRTIALADLKPYRSVMVASLITNVLALAGVIFSMQVYDRVIPGQSMSTLWVLFIGVMMATVFGQLMRVARARITDVAGKTADLRISDRVLAMHCVFVIRLARVQPVHLFRRYANWNMSAKC